MKSLAVIQIKNTTEDKLELNGKRHRGDKVFSEGKPVAAVWCVEQAGWIGWQSYLHTGYAVWGVDGGIDIKDFYHPAEYLSETYKSKRRLVMIAPKNCTEITQNTKLFATYQEYKDFYGE